MKIENGVFYTTGNPFNNAAFRAWAERADLPSQTILEPFAGANHLIGHLKSMHLCARSVSFDISPHACDVERQDTLKIFPKGYAVCITNPPWLAKNRAVRLGLPFPATSHDDLYKLSLETCLKHCSWVAVVIPESFIRTGLFRDRLSDFISLTGEIFDDTDHPVGLALFQPKASQDVMIWRDSEKIGLLSALEQNRPKPSAKIKVRFNDPQGNVGLIAIDNTKKPSIRFCDPRDLGDYPVRQSCRSITKIRVEGNVKIEEWNNWITDFRQKTADVLLTSFKGRRQDGAYRRRLDFNLAKRIIHCI